MGIFLPESWSGLPFPTPGFPPHPGIKLTSLASPAVAGGFFTTGPPGKPSKHKGHSGICGSWWNLSPLSLSPTVHSIHFTEWVTDLSLVILYSQDFGATSVMWACCQFIRTKGRGAVWGFMLQMSWDQEMVADVCCEQWHLLRSSSVLYCLLPWLGFSTRPASLPTISRAPFAWFLLSPPCLNASCASHRKLLFNVTADQPPQIPLAISLCFHSLYLRKCRMILLGEFFFSFKHFIRV